MPGQKREARLALDVPGIHVLGAPSAGVDGRVKPGHDDVETCSPRIGSAYAKARPPRRSHRHGLPVMV